MNKINHENGLTLSIPENLQHNKSASGFVVFPEGGLDRRSPIKVSVDYYTGPLAATQKKTSKTLAGKQIYYQESEYTGGSGGTEYTLDTYLVVNNGYVHTFEVIQSEMTIKPDFSLSWQLVKEISMPQ